MSKTRVIRETDYGCYVWELPNGEILGQDGDYMLVFATAGDKKAVEAIKRAAKSYGYEEGRVVFWPDVRPVSNSEYEDQLARQEAGLIPDIWDTAAIEEEWEALHVERNRRYE